MSKKKSRKNESAFNENKDKSPKIWQRGKISFKLNIRERNDLTQKQISILETMLARDTRCVFIDGTYGTGKTWLSVLAALKLLENGRCDGLIYVRNPVESSTTGKLGALPGLYEEKISPYGAPLYEKLDELLCTGDINALMKDSRIETLALGYARGRSFNCKAIIVDEATSMTYDDLVLLLTRCGEFTRIFLIGDSLQQNDIGAKTGFKRMFNVFNDLESKANGIFTFEMRGENDIVRSKILRFIMNKVGTIKG